MVLRVAASPLVVLILLFSILLSLPLLFVLLLLLFLLLLSFSLPASPCLQMPRGAPSDVCRQLESWCLHKLGATAPAVDPDDGGQQHRRKEKRGWLLELLTSCVS